MHNCDTWAFDISGLLPESVQVCPYVNLCGWCCHCGCCGFTYLCYKGCLHCSFLKSLLFKIKMDIVVNFYKYSHHTFRFRQLFKQILAQSQNLYY